jgi:hypothetical protein
MKLTTAERRAALWRDFARCYRKQAEKGRPDYWLARATRAKQEAAA